MTKAARFISFKRNESLRYASEAEHNGTQFMLELLQLQTLAARMTNFAFAPISFRSRWYSELIDAGNGKFVDIEHLLAVSLACKPV